MKQNQKSKNNFTHTIHEITQNPYEPLPKQVYKIRKIRNLTESTYILQFDKNDINFQAGQHLTLGIKDDNQVREYSIYSPSTAPYLEVLIKEVEEGYVSKKLHRVKVGDEVYVDGPFGFFTLDEKKINSQKLLFIATGTGIAPFHSMVGSYPKLDYQLIHGIREKKESYESSVYPVENYVSCTSRNNDGDFYGRVTDYLIGREIDSDTLVYLCGNCDMIYEVYDLLTSRGIDADQIKTEVYF